MNPSHAEADFFVFYDARLESSLACADELTNGVRYPVPVIPVDDEDEDENGRRVSAH